MTPEKKQRTILILRIIALIATTISLVIFPPWQGIWAWLQPLPNTVQSQVEDAVNYGLDGIIVYIDQGGKEPAFYAAGWKDRTNKVPADPHALFKIASISKLYRAAAAAKLVADGRLSLDDTLTDHLPELENSIQYADQITFRMLLQHRSGIPNYTAQPDFNWANPPATNEGRLALIQGKPADFKPNEKYSYGNTSFLLIGEILDKVLGYPNQQYIEAEILKPLGLEQTYFQLGQADMDKLVSGYHHPYKDDFKQVNFTGTAGSMVATAQDVGIFLRALNDGTLLTKEEQAIYSEIYPYGHKGWLLGYQSIARYHEDIDTVLIQFVNTTGEDSELVTTVIYNRLLKILER